MTATFTDDHGVTYTATKIECRACGHTVTNSTDLAAIIGISAPFNGPFQASPDPVVQLAQELRSGQYLPWLAAGR